MDSLLFLLLLLMIIILLLAKFLPEQTLQPKTPFPTPDEIPPTQPPRSQAPPAEPTGEDERAKATLKRLTDWLDSFEHSNDVVTIIQIKRVIDEAEPSVRVDGKS